MCTVLLLAFLSFVYADVPTVQTLDGVVFGTETETTYSFVGIPYAQPPVGNVSTKSDSVN
jgi:hypothetical protein